MGKAPHPRRYTMAECQGPLRRRIDEGNALFEVRPCGSVFA
jgi:hypothetical protein